MSKKSDKAFIEKLKTITIGTGASEKLPPCPECGKPIKGIGFVVRVEREPDNNPPQEEHSFAA